MSEEYDLVYSILVHENIESIFDLIKNIRYHSVGIKHCIFIHANTAIFQPLNDNLKLFGEYVYLHPQPANKEWGTSGLLRGHTACMKYLLEKNIAFKNYVYVDSNCLFHKEITSAMLQEYLSKEGNMKIAEDAPIEAIQKNNYEYPVWWWNNFFKNRTLVENIVAYGIGTMRAVSTVGLIYPRNTCIDFLAFLDTIQFEKNIIQETFFEEMLLGTFYYHKYGRLPSTLARMFWDIPYYRPNHYQIMAESMPMIKRVYREYDDPIRTWIRLKSNMYMLPMH